MKKEWFESEDFWKNYAPIMFDEQHWAEAAGIAQRIKEIARLKDGARVMEAGCGVGRICVELAALALDTTGIDIIQSELDTAKESAEAQDVSLFLVNADLRSFRTENHGIEKFDCAVNVYNSFGYCEKKEDDFLILKSIFLSLKDGGKFILECISRESAILFFTKGEEFERAGKKVVTDFGVVGAWEGLRSHWTLTDTKSGEIIDHEFVQRLYSAAELGETLKKIGFSNVQIYGGWDLRPYDENLQTMLILAEK